MADFRKECCERLRDSGGIDCNDEDVLANQNRGYHFRNWIKVMHGCDAVEQAAAERQIPLTKNQKGIIRLLRKHEKRSPRQLSDGLNLLRAIVVAEVDGLMRGGLINVQGNGSNKVVHLSSPEV